jgi:hypothetical protein
MGLNENTHHAEAEGYILRPLPENTARLRAARSLPHPMEGQDPFGDILRARHSVLAPRPSAPAAAAQNSHQAPPQWPEPMQEPAFYGLAGEFVRLIAPETEADPAALLLTLLVGLGCMLGRRPYYQVEDSRHGMNLFTVIVGETSKARKGTATDRALKLLARIDPVFTASRVSSGLSSGEGLIEAVRDPREEDVPVKGKEGGPVQFERQRVDNGEADKRFLVVESEFGSVLQQTGREGNILSAVLRDCWDGRPLRILARTNKDRCEAPHISLIGNVTTEELKRLLTTNDRANGFGNRILWVCSRRSKFLALGGGALDEARYEALVRRMQAAMKAAGAIDRVTFAEETIPTWEKLYAVLGEGAPGLFGSMTARAEAQVVRLATLYALLDGSARIRLQHLEAAQEVWGYCEESVRYIFGDVLGDETADGILKALGKAPQGLTQTELNRSFGSHKSASEMARALKLLQAKGLLRMERESTGGSPVTRWSLLSGVPG